MSRQLAIKVSTATEREGERYHQLLFGSFRGGFAMGSNLHCLSYTR